MRILALIPGGVGEQILFFPTLADLKEKYPDAMVDVLVEPRAKGAYRVCPNVHEVLTFDFKDRNGPADYLNVLGTIRDREYEIAISLGQQWIVGLLLWLNGIPIRVGYKTANSWFISNTTPLNDSQYAAATYHDLLKGLNIDKPCGIPSISVPKPDIDWAEGEQKRLSLTDGYVLLHAGDLADKSYPVEKWQEIIADIQAKQPDLPIALLHGSNDYDWVAKLIEQFPDLRATVPDDIGKTAAMIAGANLMVCTDSAPLHLAVAVGTYTIALCGPTKKEQLLPPDSDKFIGVQSPTGCIEDIQPTDVLAQIWRG